MRAPRKIIRAIQSALTPDLLNPQWRAKASPGDHPVTGHCYIAAEALFHVWGKRRGYRSHVISGRGWTHWFLMHPTGHRADPTKEQFGSKPIPYGRARRCGFLTKGPSKRAREIIRRIRPLL